MKYLFNYTEYKKEWFSSTFNNTPLLFDNKKLEKELHLIKRTKCSSVTLKIKKSNIYVFENTTTERENVIVLCALPSGDEIQVIFIRLR